MVVVSREPGGGQAATPRMVEGRRSRCPCPASILTEIFTAGGAETMDFPAKPLDASRRTTLTQLAKVFGRSGESRVIGWWLSLANAPHVPPPLPAWSSSRHVLAVLRGGWKVGDDLLVVDHRRREEGTRFELMGAGTSWLGPDWWLTSATGRATPARPRSWASSSVADLLEWSYRSSGLRITRTALLFRGLKLAVLGDQIDGADLAGRSLETEFRLPAGISARAASGLPRSAPAGGHRRPDGSGVADRPARFRLRDRTRAVSRPGRAWPARSLSDVGWQAVLASSAGFLGHETKSQATKLESSHRRPEFQSLLGGRRLCRPGKLGKRRYPGHLS